jgi:hypothetical protein
MSGVSSLFVGERMTVGGARPPLQSLGARSGAMDVRCYKATKLRHTESRRHQKTSNRTEIT